MVCLPSHPLNKRYRFSMLGLFKGWRLYLYDGYDRWIESLPHKSRLKNEASRLAFK